MQVRVQATINGKVAKIYKVLSSKSKSKAIEYALKLLAKDIDMRRFFFDDPDEVDLILSAKPRKKSENKLQEQSKSIPILYRM
ncbi:MAG TPA: hypothetical protein EYG93_03335 [Sulfurospirillum arcachonense]|nr:hypothetical protein [Sulfurospirillum arcachonense]